MLQVVIADGDVSPLYEPLSPDYRQKYLEWITTWRRLLEDVGDEDVAERMHIKLKYMSLSRIICLVLCYSYCDGPLMTYIYLLVDGLKFY